jgi:N-acetylmuramoyl-L-alanine amidase
MIKILLDPGHSELKNGASSKTKTFYEHEMNLHQAEKLQEILNRSGKIIADIHDPAVDNLREIGTKAKGYQCFISLHMNAMNAEKNYAVSCVLPNMIQTPSSKLAYLWTEAVAKALKLDTYTYQTGCPKGVLPSQLKVLSAAYAVKCPLLFLSEIFFIDTVEDKQDCIDRIDLAMEAASKVLIDFF